MRGVILAVLVALVAGCSVRGDGTFVVPPGEYESAFDAARKTLVEHRFTLERVDAGEGVITTREAASAGLASPWHPYQSTPGDEVEDLLNQQFRRVRVTFTLRDDGSREGRVRVSVHRVQRPGLRLSPRTHHTASLAIDPALVARGMGPGYSVPVRRDARLEARLARAIEQAVSRAHGSAQAP
jgi:hypothetical protein